MIHDGHVTDLHIDNFFSVFAGLLLLVIFFFLPIDGKMFLSIMLKDDNAQRNDRFHFKIPEKTLN